MKKTLLPLYVSLQNEEPANFSHWIQSLNRRYSNNPGTKVLLVLIATLLIITLVCVVAGALLMGGVGALVGLAVAAAISLGVGGVITLSPAIWNRIEMLITPALTPVTSEPKPSNYGAITSTVLVQQQQVSSVGVTPLMQYGYDTPPEDDDQKLITDETGAEMVSTSPRAIPGALNGIGVNDQSVRAGDGAAFFTAHLEQKRLAEEALRLSSSPPGIRQGRNGQF